MLNESAQNKKFPIQMLNYSDYSDSNPEYSNFQSKIVRSQKLILDKVGIDIVHGCQLRCVGCPNSTIQPKIHKMPPQTLRKIIDNIDVDHINLLRLFNFGEPLLHHNLPELLEELKIRKWTCSNIELSTNAQYHNFTVLEQAIKTRVLNTFSISCDGDGTPESYERLRTPSRWTKFIKFIEKISSLRDKYAPNMALITRTICTDSISQDRWLKLLVPLGFTVEFRDWLYLPESSINMTGKPVQVPKGVCSFLRPGNRLYIDYDGSVVPCCAHPQAGILGNITNNTFTQILESKRRSDFLNLMNQERSNMNICNQCPY